MAPDADDLTWAELVRVRERLHELRGIDATVAGHTLLIAEQNRRLRRHDRRIDRLERDRDVARGAAQAQAKIYTRSVAAVGVAAVLLQVLVAVLLK